MRSPPSQKVFRLMHQFEIMRMLTLLLVFIALIMPCMAELENITTGNYSISFDLGMPHNAYTISVKPPTSSESLAGDAQTEYSVSVANNMDKRQVATVSVTEYSAIQPGISATPAESESAMKKAFPESSYVASRTIDGKDGVAAEFLSGGSEFYMGIYYPTDYAIAVLFSSYPWDSGTLSLLKIVHIEQKVAV